MRTAILSILLVCLSSCGWTKLQHSGTTNAPNPAALEQTLWEQAPKYAPTSVGVTDKYFQVGKGTVVAAKRGFATTAMTTVDSVTKVYYANIADVQLYEKGRYFQVVLADSARQALYRYYTVDEAKARKFLDLVNAARRST